MIEKIIALGDAGCAVAEKFQNYFEYEVIKCSQNGDIKLPKEKTVEKIEEKMFSTKKSWKTKLNKFVGDDPVLVIISGASKSAAAALVLMEELKENEKTVIFIKSDENTINSKAKLQQRASFMILQEFARSGLLEEMIVVDNAALEKASPSINILNYYDTINDLIASTYNMINFYSAQRPVLNTIDDKTETARIATIGAFNIETGERKSYYSLDFPRETSYIYILNSEALLENTRLMSIKKINNELNENEPSNNSSFVIYRSDFEHNYGYFIQRSSFIQEQALDD